MSAERETTNDMRAPVVVGAYFIVPRSVFLVLPLLFIPLSGCSEHAPPEAPLRPAQVLAFEPLFAQNCSGCHGRDGKLGPAPPLDDPLFLAIIPQAEFKRVVTEGRRATLMPAFARGHGGPLTDDQIEALVAGVREKWGAAADSGRALPGYLQPADTADVHTLANREEAFRVFALVCGNCHGERGEGGKEAGPLKNAAFLSLISDQALRRIVITGRPDLGMPDYRRLGAMLPAGQPLTNEQIADLVTLLASWRNPPEHHK